MGQIKWDKGGKTQRDQLQPDLIQAVNPCTDDRCTHSVKTTLLYEAAQ